MGEQHTADNDRGIAGAQDGIFMKTGVKNGFAPCGVHVLPASCGGLVRPTSQAPVDRSYYQAVRTWPPTDPRPPVEEYKQEYGKFCERIPEDRIAEEEVELSVQFSNCGATIDGATFDDTMFDLRECCLIVRQQSRTRQISPIHQISPRKQTNLTPISVSAADT